MTCHPPIAIDTAAGTCACGPLAGLRPAAVIDGIRHDLLRGAVLRPLADGRIKAEGGTGAARWTATLAR